MQYYASFLIMRALVGIGEASYSTVAPTIIADLLSGNDRTFAMTVFYLAIPVGGYDPRSRSQSQSSF